MSGRETPIPFSNAPWGTCRWCGELIWRDDGTVNGRRRWHPACAVTYGERNQSSFRWRVWQRDGGVCAECPSGTPRHNRWQADHIVALADGGTWDTENGQTLCEPHHKAKSAREAAERAASRRPPAPETLFEAA